MLERLLAVVVPVFLVVLGWLVAGRRRPDLTDVNRLNMDLFVPSMMFNDCGNMGLPLA